MSETKKLMMVCYAFPPVGGAGVQRSVKFAKYLPNFGWRPTVLTVSNPSVPVLDTDLSQDLSPNMAIVRARTLEPSYRLKAQVVATPSKRTSILKNALRAIATYLLQPDSQVLWNRNAHRVGAATLSHEMHSAIYVSGPPFSSFLLGAKLKKRFKLPLVLDFRDEWSISAQYLENRSKRSGSINKQMELFESVIRQADAIVATTMASADELQRCCRRVGSGAVVRCIYNGFDQDDLKHLQRSEINRNTLRLVYTGTLWKLTDVEPFVEAALQFHQEDAEGVARLELHFVGRRTQAQDEVLDRLAATQIQLQRHDYLPHKQAMQFAYGSDALLLTLADQPGAERVVPAKVFEYMALNRDILALVPAGETRDLLSKHSLATCIHPKDTDSIRDWLIERIRLKFLGCEVSKQPDRRHDLDWCSRSNLTGQLVELIDRIRPR